MSIPLKDYKHALGQPTSADRQAPAVKVGETERILKECTDCGACVKTCNFLKHYCDSPKELAKRFSRNPLENIEIPFSCSLCGLCQRICRYDLYPGGMCHETRMKIFQPLQDKKLPEGFVDEYIIPKLEGIRYHQIFSTSSMFTLSKGPQSSGGDAVKRVFFPGCSFPAYAPGIVFATYQYLREKLPGIGVVLNCCGKPTNDTGDREGFQKIFGNTLNEFAELGVEEVVLACINCHKTFRENSDIKLRTVYEIMDEKGFPEQPSPSGQGRQVTIHDSCPSRQRPEIRKAVRSIISKLGYETNEFRFKNQLTQCCGAGGCATTGNATLADRHTQKRAAQAKGTIVTFCAHCRERFSTQGPTLHILDLVFGASYEKPLVEPHDGWQNWLDRWYLKKKLKSI